MLRVLITGMSGSGKSTVLRELQSRGFAAVDLDHGWCLPQVDGRQLWDEVKLRRVLATDTSDVLFVGGCEENMSAFLPDFDRVVLLSAPIAVLLARIDARTEHDFGKSPEERARVLADLEEVEPRLRRIAHVEVQTDRALEDVIEDVLAVVA